MRIRASRSHPAPSAEPPTAPPPRIRASPFLLVSLAVVLAATLYPTADRAVAGWGFCVLCGGRGLADALLNMALFVPLGAALARLGVRPVRAIAGIAMLSASIELAQLVIPGRDPAPPDLLFNTLGGMIGYAAGGHLAGLLRPSPRGAERLAIAWSIAFALTVAATGWLTAPSPPPGPYVGQWTPEIAGDPPLSGRVLEARIGQLPVGDGALGPEAAVQRALARADPLSVEWIVGWRMSGAAPLVRIVGRDGAEAAELFIRGEDAILIQRTRATVLRMDHPRYAAPGILRGLSPGDTLRLTVRMDGRAAVFSTDAGFTMRDAFGPGRGWMLLWSVMETPHSTARLLDALWIALWMLPLGLWMRRGTSSVGAAAVAVAGAALRRRVDAAREGPAPRRPASSRHAHGQA